MMINTEVPLVHLFTLVAYCFQPWWRHQMEIFSALLALCVWTSPVTGEFPAQRPVTRSFDVFLDLRLSKRLSKQSWGWWFETPSRTLWRHSNGCMTFKCRIHQCMLFYMNKDHVAVLWNWTKSKSARLWWDMIFMKTYIQNFNIPCDVYMCLQYAIHRKMYINFRTLLHSVVVLFRLI